jgi:hypothetical protein
MLILAGASSYFTKHKFEYITTESLRDERLPNVNSQI